MNESFTTKICRLLAFLLCVELNQLSIAQTGDAPRPNIIVILADDLGYSDLGCYGGEIPTPNLDALANRGLRFRQFYNNAVCGPTRASLLTGLHCQRIGHRGTFWNDPTNLQNCVTIGDVLKTAGYRTMMVGKWQERSLPSKLGFDRFFGPMNQAKISYFHETPQNPFYLDGTRWQFPPEGYYMTDAFTQHAVEFLKDSLTPNPKRNAKPFFLYLAYIAPHWPLHAREEEVAAHRKRYRDLGWDEVRARRIKQQRTLEVVSADSTVSPRPVTIPNWSDEPLRDWQAERMAVYAAQVTSIDRGVGQVVQTLKDAGAFDDTLILFLSDNGAAPDGGLVPTREGFGFGSQQNDLNWRPDGAKIRAGSGPDVMPGPADTFAAYGLAWATVSNMPFRSTKLTAYEGGVRTPLIAHWPKGIQKPGGWTDQRGHVVDLMATCIDLANTSYPQEFRGSRLLPLDGMSLRPVFQGNRRKEYPDLYWNAPRNQAMRSGDWKLVNVAPDKPWELYRIDRDGGETHDLSGDYPDRVRDLSTRWQTWAKDAGILSQGN